MKITRAGTAFLSFLLMLIAGCGGVSSTPKPISVSSCAPSSTPAFAYVLDDGDNTISMYTVNSCTGSLAPTTPATVPAGGNSFGSESMVVDPLGRFVYVANLGSNASDL